MPTPAEEQAFLGPVLSHYHDDGPRLIYADFLDESDDPADRARGELIRVQCALARTSDDHPMRGSLKTRELELLQEHQAAWSAHLGEMVVGVEFRRGVADAVSVDAGTFLARGDELFRLAPVRRVRILDAARHIGRLAQCPFLASVRELDLCGNDLGNGGVNVLARSPYLTRVETLDLSFNGLCDGGVRLLARATGFSRLRALYLTDNGQISAEGVRALAESPHLGGLRVLDVSGNDVGDAGVKAVVSSRYLTRLYTFRVYANHIGDAGAAELAGSSLLRRMLEHNPNLDLRNSAIGPAGAIALVASPSLARAKGLNLSGNYLGDAGVRAVAESPHLVGVKRLAVRQNQITDAGAFVLAGSSLMSRLTYLDVSVNRLSQKGVDSLWYHRRDFQTVLETSGNLTYQENVGSQDRVAVP
ncbi:TIGR02996 domain-containing protein [Fimbriiglobus ruber]|uniref:Putative GALA PROTEIN n=1 Tax=Fimbriiglobus ruber TaxID=1908690 RepID=A0A225EGB8_9BACT|nr:TIGR02996 domain-containing protein [Fimbriiglobus ruber]OWK47375.1 putative GALA PROTEIN [Fimbriiglobus ruber]